MDLDTLDELYIRELNEIVCFERSQVERLPEFIAAVGDSNLSESVSRHLKATERHLTAMEAILAPFPGDPTGCDAADAMISECLRIADDGDGHIEIRDAALVAAIQKIEHLEIAMYGTASAHASERGTFRDADKMIEIMEEEGVFDRQLTRLAERHINFRAADQ